MVSLDRAHLPRHIAIIMDGNGRWAQRHALGRITGHKRGARAVRVAVETCRELGIGCLTLYAFSQENWQRPPEEVQALMRLLEDYLRTEIGRMIENDIRLVTIGDTPKLTAPVRAMLSEGMRKTEKNRSMTLNLALSYGGRDEIVAAAKRVVREVEAGRLDPDALTPERFSRFLFTADLPDPDLLIRTSGEYRISNFLLWQMAYTEFYFTDVLWPDFRRKHLLEAIADYQRRERRFGLTSEQLPRE
ncbi:MAG TPA: isoprenyl transferase [Syntrophales bacterium]|nr:isoprenyl transferase [Syntrophales bacterium]